MRKITWESVMEVNKIYRTFDSCKTRKQLFNAIGWAFGLNMDKFCSNAFLKYISLERFKKLE